MVGGIPKMEQSSPVHGLIQIHLAMEQIPRAGISCEPQAVAGHKA